MRGRDGTVHRYYDCRNHDRLRAGGEHRRCKECNIHADAFDAFVFDQARTALVTPEALLAGERAVSERRPVLDDELLASELERQGRRSQSS